MKKLLSKKHSILTLTIIVFVVFLLSPQTGIAADTLDALGTIANVLTAPMNFIQGIFGQILYFVVLWPLNLYVRANGFALDVIIRMTFGFSAFYKDSPAIKAGWVAVRDVCNLFFIFILIFASIKTIIYSKVQKDLIKNTILGAIAINFSMFVVLAMIDIGNILSIWIYNAILSATGTSGGLGSALGAAFNPAKFLGSGSLVPSAITDNSGLQAVIILCVITFLIAQTFTKANALFIGRMIAFVFHIILAPVGMLSLFKLAPKEFSDEYDWWKNVKEDALMPVYYLLLLFVSIYFTISVKDTLSATKAGDLIGAGGKFLQGSSFGIVDFIIFYIIYKLFDQSYTIAKKHSGSITSKIGGAINAAFEVAKVVAMTIATAGVGTALQGSRLGLSLAKTAGGTGMRAMAAQRVLTAARGARSTGTMMTKITGAVSKNFDKYDLKKAPGVGQIVADATKSKADIYQKGMGVKGIVGGLVLSARETAKNNLEKFTENVIAPNSEGDLDIAGRQRMAEYAKNFVDKDPSSLRGLAAKLISKAGKGIDAAAKKEVDEAIAEQMETKEIEVNGVKTKVAPLEQKITADVSSHKTQSTIRALGENKSAIKEREEKINKEKEPIIESENKLTQEIANLNKNLGDVKKTGSQLETKMRAEGFEKDPENLEDNSGLTDTSGKPIPTTMKGPGDKIMTVAEYKALHAAAKNRIEQEHSARITELAGEISKKEEALRENEGKRKLIEKETEDVRLEIEALNNNISVGELKDYKETKKKLEEIDKGLSEVGWQFVPNEPAETTKRRHDLLEGKNKLGEMGEKVERARNRKEKPKGVDGKEIDTQGMTDDEIRYKASIEQVKMELRGAALKNINKDLGGTKTYKNYTELSEGVKKAQDDEVKKNRELVEKKQAEEYSKPKEEKPPEEEKK
jgi:hypothetical protein